MNYQQLALFALMASLAACAPAENAAQDKIDVEASCRHPIQGGRTTVALIADELTCPACTAMDPDAAIDGDPDSAATMVYAGVTIEPEQGYILRVQAQPGVVYPGGSRPGATIGLPAVLATGSIYIRTLLDGKIQNGGLVQSSVVAVSPSPKFYSITAKKPFDTVDVIISAAGVTDVRSDDVYLRPGAGPMVADVYEVCADGKFRVSL